MIELEHVTKTYGAEVTAALALLEKGESRDAVRKATGQVVALHDVSLNVERGEILVVMGLSGCGKSTLLRCMNMLVRPDAGRVWIERKGKRIDLTKADDEQLRTIRQTQMAMVFQNRSLLPWRTVRQNVALGLEIRGLSESEIQKTVDEKLDLVGLADWKEKALDELSGGMQQRVGIARALAMETDILLLDEPFSALDPLIRSKMQDELLSLQKQIEKTMVFVSHDFDEALKLGSRIVILEQGGVTQTGSPSEILRQPGTEHVKKLVETLVTSSKRVSEALGTVNNAA